MPPPYGHSCQDHRVGGDELVAIYDDHARVVGSTTRADVRARGLWHAAAVVLVRSGDGGSVYVHRRTATKDVYPSAFDCWAGGVVAAGETPDECARRELGEELGIHGVRPVPLFSWAFEQGSVRCHNFTYEVRWDEPVVHQPEEVADGWWMPLEELHTWLRADDGTFVPDGRLGTLEWFRRFGRGSPR
ncbi:NUDIX hydrolase [Prauserella rugosa]|uniref:NUDIX hydrolase n=1 Tax=Prauserella rugosa TaxID=43354 RepID=UPI0006721694|nr:NUDIX domain-containing protein [Prauserella rugosa]KMS83484.1 NUDIX hydrolase [Streptomyces regensis]